jgi:hypothetical protein
MKSLVVLLPLLLTAGCASGGWTEYRDTLTEAYGMAPYRNPVGGWGPGTVLRLGAGEDDAPSLRFTAGDVFTGARADVFADPQPLGDTQASRISKIRFSAAASGEDGNILPADVSASFSFALTENTSVTWAATGAELHALKEGKVEIALGQLDPGDATDKQFLDDLLNERMILLSAVLFVKAAEFTFETDQELSAEVRARIEQEADRLEAEVAFDSNDQRRFRLLTANPLYFAYTTYPIDRVKLRVRYGEKQALHEDLRALAARRSPLEAAAARLRDDQQTWAKAQEALEAQLAALDVRPKTDAVQLERDEVGQRLAELSPRQAGAALQLADLQRQLSELQEAERAAAARLQQLNSTRYDESPPAG